MGVHIRVKCPVCNGHGTIGKAKPGHWIDHYCKACSGTGRKLVWEEVGEARGRLLQKQIDDAKL